MLSRRCLLRLGCGATVALVISVMPLTLSFGPIQAPTTNAAHAKDGNNGNGGGNGNGGNNGHGSSNGNGNGSSNGNGAGSAGNSSSNAGGNGNGNGNGGAGASGNPARAGSSSPSSPTASSASGVKATERSDGSVDVRHGNGITETLRRGRYIMRDSKGRTIVDRQATANDVRRLNRIVR